MLVSPVNLKILAHTLDLEGHHSLPVLRQCGFDSIDELDRSPWVPLELFDRMMHLALEESMDPSFGLTAGGSVAVVRYGVIAPLVMQMPTLRQGIADILRFTPLVLQRPEIDLVESRGRASIVFDPAASTPVGRQFRSEATMVPLLQMLRFVGAGPTGIQGVDFAHEWPAYGIRYAPLFGPRVRFAQADYAIHFDAALLDTPLPWHEKTTYLSALARAESALASSRDVQDKVHELRELLMRSFPGQPTSAEAASHLGTSERSLRRHLAACGVSYGALARETQQLMAERLLGDDRQSIKQVADALGFSSVSCFHRAFRRWTGITPAAWRAHRRGGPSS